MYQKQKKNTKHMEILIQPQATSFIRSGIQITLTENNEYFIVSACRKFKTGRLKCVFGYKFRTATAREVYVSNYFTELEKAEMEKKNLKILKQEVKHFIENPYKLGDVLVNSWGYDQTNVNFYQVVEVKAKSVVIIEICYKVVENSAGYDSCRVVPVKDNFVNNKSISKRIREFINSEGEPDYYFSSAYGSLLKHQEGETHYKSWYA